MTRTRGAALRGAAASAATPVLSVENLSKSCARLLAVNDVSFSIGRREIVGLLGPNGAGKTTIINTILGVLAPSAGTSPHRRFRARRPCSPGTAPRR